MGSTEMQYILTTYLGHGNGRVTWLLSNGHVLKIPYNLRGIEQNQQEYDKYTSGTSPYYGDIISYDQSTHWLVMEYLDTRDAEYFQDYVIDQTHCSLYDDSVDAIVCCCDARCDACQHNVVIRYLPEYYLDVLAVSTKDKPQIGYNVNKNLYQHYDYGDPPTTGSSEWCFTDSFADLFKQYIEQDNDPMLFYDYLIQNNIDTAGSDMLPERDLIHRQNKLIRRKYCRSHK